MVFNVCIRFGGLRLGERDRYLSAVCCALLLLPFAKMRKFTDACLAADTE